MHIPEMVHSQCLAAAARFLIANVDGGISVGVVDPVDKAGEFGGHLLVRELQQETHLEWGGEFLILQIPLSLTSIYA